MKLFGATADTNGLVFFALALVVVPGALSIGLVGADVLQWLLASALWVLFVTVVLGVWTPRSGTTSGERIGWSLIVCLFWSWLGVPICAVVFVAMNLPYSLF